MEGVLTMIRHTTDAASGITAEQQAILDEIKEVTRQIACTELWFEMESDSDLIEACIYQREALSARYRYLLSIAKQHEISSSPFK